MFQPILVSQDIPSMSNGPLALTHLTVIDATGGPAQPDMTVIVSGNRITELADSPA